MNVADIVNILRDDNSSELNNINHGYILGKDNQFIKPDLSYIKDSIITTDSDYSSPVGAYENLYPTSFPYSTKFKGFYRLSLLIEDPIISGVIDVIANDMVNNFGDIVYIGDEDPNNNSHIQDKIKIINKRFDDLKVRYLLEQAVRNALLLGGCGIFIEINKDTDSIDLKTPINGKVSTNSLITNLKLVDPSFMIPIQYNTTNPLDREFYTPQVWQVMDQEVHTSRIPQVIFQHLPYFLRPIYNFQGISLSQKMEPLVNDFYSVKSNIVKITKRMRTFIIMSNLSALFDPNCSKEDQSSVIANMKRLKDGDTLTSIVLDKETEDFKDVSSSISGLSDLLSTFAEQICVASQTPISKTWGQAPKGLNATGEGDIKNYYNMISGNQRNMMYPLIKYLIELICYEQFGQDIDGIDFRFNPINSVSPKEKAELQALKVGEYSTLTQLGVLSPDDVRSLLINDDSNEYTSFDKEQENIEEIFDNGEYNDDTEIE
ncbi:MAG: anti-CBASS protein Acb1 family protein [Cetobacterium sp.]